MVPNGHSQFLVCFLKHHHTSHASFFSVAWLSDFSNGQCGSWWQTIWQLCRINIGPATYMQLVSENGTEHCTLEPTFQMMYKLWQTCNMFASSIHAMDLQINKKLTASNPQHNDMYLNVQTFPKCCVGRSGRKQTKTHPLQHDHETLPARHLGMLEQGVLARGRHVGPICQAAAWPAGENLAIKRANELLKDWQGRRSMLMVWLM